MHVLNTSGVNKRLRRFIVLAAAGFSPKATQSAALGVLDLALGVLLIGGITVFIGDVLTFVVNAFKPYRRCQNLCTTGILFVLDIASLLVGISGIFFVGYILMYIAPNRALFSFKEKRGLLLQPLLYGVCKLGVAPKAL